MIQAKILISLKDGVLDAQGKAVNTSLVSLGYSEVKNVRVGKYIVLELDTDRVDEAERRVKEMCDRLLANPVIERYEFRLVEGR